MNRFSLYLLGALAFIVLLVATGAVFTVHQTKQALVLQFGQIEREVKEPGLNFKIPFVQNVVYYDNRTLDIDPPPFEVLLTDKKRINVDAYARYRIISPSLYYQRIQNEARLRDRFGKTTNAALQRVLATVSLDDVLSPRRNEIMAQIEREVSEQAVSFGIEVVDVRIGRTDLPPQTSQAVFSRMRTEREREARELRAEGNEIAQVIRAGADKERTLLIATAEKQNQILRGQGEANRTRILARAFTEDEEFFLFYRALQAYRASLATQDTTLLLSPNSAFFQYFSDPNGR